MQKFIVTLVGVFTIKDLPEDYEQFVEYRATMDNIELTEDVPIAILQVKDTTCYHVLFLDKYTSMDEIDKEVEETLDGQIYNYNVRKILEGHLNEQ